MYEDNQDGSVDIDITDDKFKSEATHEEIESKEDEIEVQEETDEVEQASSQEDDKEQYGKRAQKRIQGLIRRQKAAEADMVKLVEQNTQLTQKIEQLSAANTKTEDLALDQMEKQIASEEAALKTAFTAAYDEGDAGKLADVQTSISSLQARKALLEAQKNQRARVAETRKTQTQEGQDQPQQPQRQQNVPNARELFSDRALDWIKEHDWFGAYSSLDDGTLIQNSNFDSKKTAAALNVHKELEAEGITEADDPDEYFGELTRRVNAKVGGGRKAQSPVSMGQPAGAGKASSKKVTLTKEQVAFCDRWNINKREYARQVALMDQNN